MSIVEGQAMASYMNLKPGGLRQGKTHPTLGKLAKIWDKHKQAEADVEGDEHAQLIVQKRRVRVSGVIATCIGTFFSISREGINMK